MATLAPWAHRFCPPISLGFRTCQEVLNHMSIFTGPSHCPCSPVPGLQQNPDFLRAKHSPHQSPARPDRYRCASSYHSRGKAVSLSLRDCRKGSSDLTPHLDCPYAFPMGCCSRAWFSSVQLRSVGLSPSTRLDLGGTQILLP